MKGETYSLQGLRSGIATSLLAAGLAAAGDVGVIGSVLVLGHDGG